MSDTEQLKVGSIIWHDLTVQNAAEIRDFYNAVVGWTATPHPLETHVDFDIHPPDSEEVVAGICHKVGDNANLPAQWLVYIIVADVDESAARAINSGGKVVDGPRDMGPYRFCVVQDPAGAVAALLSQK